MPTYERRTQQTRALRNDDALRAASSRVIAALGWHAATLDVIGADAGLTKGAVYARHRDKRELGVTLWREVLRTPLEDRLEQVAEAALAADDADRLESAMRVFLVPGHEIRAAVEMLQAALHDEQLGREILPEAREMLAGWLVPTRRRSRAQAAIAATASYLALGLVLVSERPWVPEIGDAPITGGFQRAFALTAKPRTLPRDRATYLDLDRLSFGTGDERLERAYHATVEVIGTLGYDGATIADICRTGDVSAGFLYKRFTGKLELFAAVLDAALQAGFDDNLAFHSLLADKYGQGIADAVLWREIQRPHLAVNRAIQLESNRLAMHLPAMAAIRYPIEAAYVDQFADTGSPANRADRIAYVHTRLALPFGLMLVANMLPTVWKLPYDCVTVPLADAT